MLSWYFYVAAPSGVLYNLGKEGRVSGSDDQKREDKKETDTTRGDKKGERGIV